MEILGHMWNDWTTNEKIMNAARHVAGFELTFESCIVKNSYKISLSFSFLRMCTMAGPGGQKMSKFCMLLIAAGKCIFQCKLMYLVKGTQQPDLRMENVFRMRKM